MSYQDIEVYGDGQCRLVEDEDGVRILIVGFMPIPKGIWVQALAAGAAAIIWATGGPADWPEPVGFMLADDFMGVREEREGFFYTPEDAWRHSEVALAYRQMVTAPKLVKKPGSTAFVHLHAHSEFCLAPETRVCTADMKWKPISDVVVGEQLVGFDEDLRPEEGQRGNSRSKMRRTEVTHVTRVMRGCYRLVLEDGTEIVSSAEHGWVVVGTTRGSLISPDGPAAGYGSNTRRWLKTRDFATSSSVLWKNRDVSLPKMVLWASPWDPEVADGLGFEAGWLAGILDGEGWIHEGQLSLGQNPGVVLDEMERVCKALGYPLTETRPQGAGRCLTFRFRGYETALRAISQCRPLRFLDRMDEVWVGRRAGGRYTRPVQVVAVEYLGERETVAITTSTKTFVAEGFLSHNSPLDGLSKVDEMVDAVVTDGQPALAVTDHGVCAAHPHLQVAAEKAGIKPIFGIEAYFVNDRLERPPPKPVLDKDMPVEERKVILEAWQAEADRVKDYYHLVLWAMNDTGLRNLWAASTQANIKDEGFYGKPRMDWDILERFSEGLMCSTACLRGPVAAALRRDDLDLAMANLHRLQAIFKDRLYMEVHTSLIPDVLKVNVGIAEIHQTTGIPIIGVVDSHYPCASDKEHHKVWLAAQTNSDIADDTSLFEGDADYHIMTAEEVRKNLSLSIADWAVDRAMSTTIEVANLCSARIGGKPEPPVFSKQGGARRDIERLTDICLGNWGRKISGKTNSEALYAERFEYEMKLLIDAGFCGYFDIVNDYTRAAKAAGKMMGPSRGSGGGSLVAYLSDITELDPIETDLLFERFLTPGRKSLPDFDLDFPASARDYIEGYVSERWGEDYVVRVGTHIRLKNKGVIKEMFKVLKSRIDIHWPDQDAIAKIITEAESDTAGKGLPWDDLMELEGERLAPFIQKYPLVFHHAARLAGRLKSYGKHAAGVVISTQESLLDRLPLRPGTNQMVSDFDMEALESIGLVKFDLLTLRTMDTIQMAVDLIRERHGVEPDIYNWRDEYKDPYVWDQICEGRTLGLFQVETSAVTKLTKQFKPRSVSDLSDVITIVRPGPKRSGLTDMYLRRRDGLEPVTVPHPKLEPVLAKTLGCILYQEDVMAVCMMLAGYDGTEADTVRKILGKKQVEKVIEEGKKFVARCLENGVEREVSEPLWNQMAEFAKYSFNRAHAYAYAMIGYWTAWLKFKYPIEFITAALSTVDKDRIPEFIQEARRMKYRVLPPDINTSGRGFNAGDGVVRYGLDSIKGVGEAAVEAIVQGQPYASFEDFMARKGSAANIGVIKILVAVGAFDILVPNRAALELHVKRMEAGDLERCVDWSSSVVGPNGLPCQFDWANEPVKLGKSGRPLKRKDPPKKCTKACRQYRKVDAGMVEVVPYTDAEIRDKEMEYLGVHLSSTPFDRIPEEKWGTDVTLGSDIDSGPVGNYDTVGIITKVKPHTTMTGEKMGFIALNAKDATLDITVFKAYWKDYAKDCQVGRMVFARIRKEDRRDKPGEQGLMLLDLLPL